MKTVSQIAALVLVGVLPPLLAATDRILEPVDPNRTVVLAGSLRPSAQLGRDSGLAEPTLELSYVTVLLKPNASLEEFLIEQQSPSSPNYHQWLTPEQFGERFGFSHRDIAKLTGWITSQGLQVNDVARGGHWITFSGTAEQVGRALRTQVHRYLANGEQHFANSSELSIPEAFRGVIAGIRGLDDFRPQSSARVIPQYNSGSSHYLAPGDVATMYNISPLYAAGITGTGQKLVIAGQTDVGLSDIQEFRRQFNLPPIALQLVLFGQDPGLRPGDLLEADLDIELAGAVAQTATIIYAYATNVFVASQYAIDQNLGSVVSISYGVCEAYESTAYRAVAQQANAQGITVFAPSGDYGAVACDSADPTSQASKGLEVLWPASFPEVTAVGGTELDDSGGNYWAPSNALGGGSALSYIPETAWTDAALLNSIKAGGGGSSHLFPKPAWQTGPGVPSDGARDLPDVSLSASSVRYPYMIRTGGFVAGVAGTSAATPLFAGIAALTNSYLFSSGTLGQSGLGNINPNLYRMAQAATNVFHDITAGDSDVPCEQGSPSCTDGLIGFNAGAGYDLATGLGSVDANNLVTKWSSGALSSMTLVASASSVGLRDPVSLIATVGATLATGRVPAGSVAFLINNVNIGTVALTLEAGSMATAMLTITGMQLAVGNGTVIAVYSGDVFFQGSTGSTTVAFRFVSSGGSLVVPWVTPNPVSGEGGGLWPYTVGLTEKAGVSTTLTGFTIDGASQSLGFWTSLKLPANGTIYASLSASNLTTPSDRIFIFTGTDVNGATWTQQITVSFLAPSDLVLVPQITFVNTTPTVARNPQADPSCQWSQQLAVEEKGGYGMLLTQLTLNGFDLSSGIQGIFGTTRLAPFGLLEGNLCLTREDVPLNTYQIAASTLDGILNTTLSATTSSSFEAALTNPPIASVSPTFITVSVADASHNGTATINLDFANGTPAWRAIILPSTSASSWLTIAQASGVGSGQLMVRVSSAGLSSGAYTALVTIQTPDCAPQIMNVPVTLIVGASTTTSIVSVQNKFSGGSTVAPGMMVTVLGSQLAPAATYIVASRLPLAFTMNGVSATVNGISAPLYAVSPNQIDLQIPYETGTWTGTAALAINNNGQVTSFSVPIAIAAPGLYPSPIDSSSGKALTSVHAGQVLVLFMTGEGDVTPTLATGATPSQQPFPAAYPRPRLPVSVTIGGEKTQVLFAGIPNGIVAEAQINIVVPMDVPLGPQALIATVGAYASFPITVNVEGGS